MSSIGSRYVLNPYEIPNIETLPVEISGEILHFLNDFDISSLARVSKKMSTITIKQTEINKYMGLKTLIDNVIQELCEDMNAAQIKSLNDILEEMKLSLEGKSPNLMSNVLNLITLNKSIDLIKNKIIDVLMTLDEAKLNFLKTISVPSFFENIFLVVEICKRIDEASNILDNDDRSFALKEICKDLTRAGDFNRAIKVAKTILYEYDQDLALKEICKAIIQAGDFNLVFKAVKSIQSAYLRMNVLVNICEVLIHARDFNQALKAAKSIPIGGFNVFTNNRVQHEEIEKVCKALIQARDFNQAIEVANTISDEGFRAAVLVNICDDLIKDKEFHLAIKAAKAIPVEAVYNITNNRVQRESVIKICKALIWSGDSGDITLAGELATLLLRP